MPTSPSSSHARSGEPPEEIERDFERRAGARAAECQRRLEAKPEPKDKLSDERRYWKLRQFDKAFDGGDAGPRREAPRYFHRLLRETTRAGHVSVWLAWSLTPHLISEWQRREAGRKGGAK